MITFKRFLPDSKTIPEITTGFDYLNKSDYQFTGNKRTLLTTDLPTQSYVADGFSGKTYEISVTIKAIEDIPLLFLYSGKRHLEALIQLKKDQVFELSFYNSLTETIPFQSETKYELDKLFVTYSTEFLENVSFSVSAKPKKIQRIFLCGDSTVADQGALASFVPAMSYSSWGQTLSLFLDSEIAVDNQATSGNTTESFRNEGHYDIVTKHIQANDFCLFQFGHNDQKLAHLLPNKDYKTNLVTYIEEIKKKGAIPILVTPLGRNTWDSENNYLDLLVDYAAMVKKIGTELNVPVIDLHRMSTELWRTLGLTRSTDYFPKNDYTHTNEFGSYKMAKFIAEQLSLLYPDVFKMKETLVFEPEPNMWQLFQNNQLDNSAKDDSGQLHEMESSIKNLIEIVQEVKEHSSEK